MANSFLAFILLVSLQVSMTYSQEQQQEQEQKAALGSKENPIRCDGVEGERAYLSRLRDQDGKPLDVFRFGSAVEESPYGQIMDIYGIETPDGKRGKIYMDMYHSEYVCKQPLSGLRLLFEQDHDYEYVDGKIHALGAEQPFTGDIKSTDDRGNLRATCRVEEGQIKGEQKYFYENDKVQIEYPYKDGVRHGEAVWYREDGKVWAKLPFTEGRLEGTQSVFNEEVIIEAKVPYKDHQVHGTVKVFYPDGSLKQTTEFKLGVKDGLDIQYDLSGNVTEKTEYVKGVPKQG